MIWNSKQKETAASDTQSWRTPVQLVPSFHSLPPKSSSNSSVSFSVPNCNETLIFFMFFIFYRKQMASGARQCLSTGHRKHQDFLLWILPLWTLVAQIRSSASTSGQCASCKVVSRDVSGRTLRLLN